MKTLLTAILLVLTIASSAMALECPEGTPEVLLNETDRAAAVYTCSNGMKIWFAILPQAATEEELVKSLTGKTYKELLGIYCFTMFKSTPYEFEVCP